MWTERSFGIDATAEHAKAELASSAVYFDQSWRQMAPLCVLYERTADGKNAANVEWQKSRKKKSAPKPFSWIFLSRKETKAFVRASRRLEQMVRDDLRVNVECLL